MKRKSIILIIGLLLSGVTVACNSPITSQADYSKATEEDSEVEYIHSFDPETNLQETIGDITYSVPESWSPEYTEDGNYYYPEDGMLCVTGSYDSFDVTDSTFKEEFLSGFSSEIDNYTDIDNYNSQINGVDFFVADFSGIMSDIPVNGRNYSFSHAGIFYSFFYCDTNVDTNTQSHIRDFEEVIKSIEFIATTPTEEPLPSPSATAEPIPEETADPSVPIEYLSALEKAKDYSELMHMSKKGLFDQLTSEYGEQFSEEAAQYAVDNVNADWNANALETAKSYSENMHMSKQGIYDQLVSEYGEQFTAEEAQYAVDNLEADYNYNALQTAISYQENMNMSPEAIRDQLTSEYGEQFTQEEADYAIEHLPQ